MTSGALRKDSLRAAVRAAGITVEPRFHERIGSTNAEAMALAAAGAPEWTVVAAGHQTRGRGRMGRRWVEAPGKALLMTVVLRPPLPPKQAPLLSLMAATALAQACRELSGAPVGCKWPNDLVVGERKLAGVLAEAEVADGRVSHVAIGTGVNVGMEAGDFPEGLRRTATSLAVEGRPVDAAVLARRYLEILRERYRPAHPAFTSGVVDAYRERCVSLGRRVGATTTTAERVEGVAAAIDEWGGLVIVSGSRRVTVAFGEIAHLGRGHAPAEGELPGPLP